MPEKLTRRTFTKTGVAALAVAGAQVSTVRAEKIVGANERIRVGFIGVGNRGSQVANSFRRHDDMEIVALCDVDANTVAKAKSANGGKGDTYGDFRRVIDRKDIDAVVIATPDHWHAIQMITACDAGKDVYVEKPLSMTVVEGRHMVEAARRNKRVVQVGTHRRSSPLYAELAQRSKQGDFGKLCVARSYHTSNMFPDGIGHEQPKDPPKELDWEMWLGPRPQRPYQDNIAPYKFRWWQQFSSQIANWGVHYLDAMRWCFDELAPASVCAMGGKYAVDDDRTIPDTMEVCFDFASERLAVFGVYETSSNRGLPQGELELRGTQGTVYIGGNKYEVVPERGGQFQSHQPRMKPETVEGEENNSNLTALHARNFLDCMRSRKQTNADVETGHRSTTFSLLANISLAMGERLRWDAEKERFTNNDAANDLLHYEYRKPWTLG